MRLLHCIVLVFWPNFLRGNPPIVSTRIALRFETEAVKSDNVMTYLLSPLTKQCWPRYSRAPCFLGCRQAPQAQPRRRVGSVRMCVCMCVSSPAPPHGGILLTLNDSPLCRFALLILRPEASASLA